MPNDSGEVFFDSVPRFFLTRYLEIIKPGTSKLSSQVPRNYQARYLEIDRARYLEMAQPWFLEMAQPWFLEMAQPWFLEMAQPWFLEMVQIWILEVAPMLIVTRSWASHAPQGGRPRSSTCNWPGPRRCRTRCSHWYTVKLTFAPEALGFVI